MNIGMSVLKTLPVDLRGEVANLRVLWCGICWSLMDSEWMLHSAGSGGNPV